MEPAPSWRRINHIEFMDLIDIVVLLGLLLVIGVWYTALHMAEKETMRKLGPDVTEIPLNPRWTHSMRWVIPVFVIGGPAAFAIAGVLLKVPSDEIFFEICKVLGFGAMLHNARKTSVLMIGSRGMSLGPKHQVEWDRVDELKWDKDIGQRLWGLTLSVWDPKRKHRSKYRYYVRRQMRDEVMAQIARFRGAVPGAEVNEAPAVASPVPVG